MNLDQMYQSEWLKASDLQGQTVPATIDRVQMEEVGDGSKPVLHFQGRAKGLVLNKTNAMSIGLVHGQDTDLWIGKTIELFPAVVMFQGQNVPCIRVRPVAAAYAEAFQPAMPTQAGYGAPERPVPPAGPGDQAAALAVQAPLTPPASTGDGQTAPITDKTVLGDEIKF